MDCSSERVLLHREVALPRHLGKGLLPPYGRAWLMDPGLLEVARVSPSELRGRQQLRPCTRFHADCYMFACV